MKKKLTTYQEVKEYYLKNIIDENLIDIDNYTDEENEQITRWLIQAGQEVLTDEELLNLTDDEVSLIGLNNKNIMLNVIKEESENFNIDGKIIVGKCIIDYPEFKIIKEDNKNNFYRIMKNVK